MVGGDGGKIGYFLVSTNPAGQITAWDVNLLLAAPEIDPASAASGLTLLVGGLVVLRGRRSRCD